MKVVLCIKTEITRSDEEIFYIENIRDTIFI